ncbi:glycoside hydrolase family 3 protein, partial [Neotamlana sedimentorum]|uniref:glycoside hydrolase family 3 protein n=1 Tax=Neotamlana sedimentorum TaxID=1435349 RepID=UPI0005CB9F50
MNKILTVGVLALIFIVVSCKKPKQTESTSIYDGKMVWVDSVYNSMTLKEKVGQLFMVAAYSNRDKKHTDSIQSLIKNEGIGGLIFFQGGPLRQAELTNTYQSVSKVPLLIGIDGEWGLNMRLDSTARFPYNMTLGAIKNDSLIYKIGSQIGKHCKRLGIHVNFAPVVDINTNPKNPIIGVRSFGEDKFNVANKAIAFTQGMQREGVMACAKHFPGHGDTSQDSHKTLPTVSFSKQRIDSVELYPFKKLFKKDIAGVMVAHLNVPSLEPVNQLPSSLSYSIVTDILKKQINFNGLIFTDALNMKGAANYKEPGDIDLAAFKAGNDVLLFTENAQMAILKIVEAYNKNEISEERLAYSVKKILKAKYEANLHQFTPINSEELIADLNSDANLLLNEEALSKAITMLKNADAVLPVSNQNEEKIAYLKLGNGTDTSFITELQSEIKVKNLTGISKEKVLQQIKKYDKVIISYHRLNSRSTKNISAQEKAFIETIANKSKVILNVFASQYAVNNVAFKNIEGLIISFENTEIAQKISAQIVLGKKQAIGQLPASINNKYHFNYGL